MIPGISGNVTVLLLLLENLIITQIIKREEVIEVIEDSVGHACSQARISARE